MVENSSPLQTARDLNGKTVAVDGLRNITQFAVMAWMDKNGGDPSSLKFVEMPFAEMGAALAAKRVDAAQISEPAASGARANARVFAQSYDAIGSSFATTAWVATAAWAHANPGIVKRLVQTVYDGARWANVNRDRTAEVLSKVSGMQIDVIRRINRSTFAERYTPGLITPVIDVALRYGAITKAITPNDVFAMDALR
jgi:ABC-type nitrate/sulfonate/bicarbonate transport system substrate-binding protein